MTRSGTQSRPKAPAAAKARRIGIVSLGCPKALVDSERILTRLRAEGYAIAPTYQRADLVLVNTCGFIDSARKESLDAIGEALEENGKVVVTGCLGAEGGLIRERYPDVLAVTGPHQYEAVVEAVHKALPPKHDPFVDLVPPEGIKLTPRHYAYLKISEGCNHRCSFCIIPALRGDLVSRPIGEVLAEAEALASTGAKALLVVSQDTSAYGLDIRYAQSEWRGRDWTANLEGLCRGLGELGLWTRLHYVYPYPHVDQVIPLMAEGKILPYLDIPFQHAAPNVLKAMKRPAAQEKTLERIARWREIAPDLTIRSTFVVGFPGETEADFEFLMDWLEEAQLDRVGCFAYENVAGASARDLPGHVPEEIKQARRERLMAASARISRARLKKKVGRTIEVIVDAVAPDGLATCRSKGDAPEIDGKVWVPQGAALKAGDIVKVRVDASDDFDLTATPTDFRLRSAVPAAQRRMHRVITRR